MTIREFRIKPDMGIDGEAPNLMQMIREHYLNKGEPDALRSTLAYINALITEVTKYNEDV